jgi:chromosome segregation ATPase
MKRIYAEPPDELMAEIAKATDRLGINRHQLVLKAIDSFLHGNGSTSDSLRKDFDSLKIELDSLRSNRDSLMAELEKKRSEIDSLKKAYDSLQDKFDSQTIKMNQLAIKKDSLSDELKQSVIAYDSLKRDLSHANDIIKLKDEDIGYLKASYHELVQRLTPQLPPSQEEAKKKGWWQFWK